MAVEKDAVLIALTDISSQLRDQRAQVRELVEGIADMRRELAVHGAHKYLDRLAELDNTALNIRERILVLETKGQLQAAAASAVVSIFVSVIAGSILFYLKS